MGLSNVFELPNVFSCIAFQTVYWWCIMGKWSDFMCAVIFTNVMLVFNVPQGRHETIHSWFWSVGFSGKQYFICASVPCLHLRYKFNICVAFHMFAWDMLSNALWLWALQIYLYKALKVLGFGWRRGRRNARQQELLQKCMCELMHEKPFQKCIPKH